ncbi:transmembrane protein 272-like [Mercenaria mercenaria]|uniref:transmembrane protein 272-like n=1 Tax=Mercenaria mercenaria TaxID=6596 RepID=UPI00234E7E58|nr:transmembrane protein 272-like [Mercenaria mercenaria]
MGHGDGSGEAGGQGQGHGHGRGDKGFLAGACCIIIIVVLLVLSIFGLNIAKIVMGAAYVNDCPVEKLIPIYLIVSGCSSVLMGGLSNLKKKDDDIEEDGIKGKCNVLTIIGTIGLLFNFVWLICGSVWVFGNYSDVIDGCGVSNDCCDTSLIKFALAVTIIDWIFIGLILVAICCLCGAICCGMFCCKTKVGE